NEYKELIMLSGFSGFSEEKGLTLFYPGSIPRCGFYTIVQKEFEDQSTLRDLLERSSTKNMSAYVFVNKGESNFSFHYISKKSFPKFKKIIVSKENQTSFFNGNLYITLGSKKFHYLA